jgi:hypothetical protein
MKPYFCFGFFILLFFYQKSKGRRTAKIVVDDSKKTTRGEGSKMRIEHRFMILPSRSHARLLHYGDRVDNSRKEEISMDFGEYSNFDLWSDKQQKQHKRVEIFF